MCRTPTSARTTCPRCSPCGAPKQGLTVVTLVGENLAAAQPLYCLFDNVSVTAVQVTPQLAECTSPASTLAPADPSEYAATFAVSYNLQEQLTHLLGGGPALNFTYDNLSVTAVGPGGRLCAGRHSGVGVHHGRVQHDDVPGVVRQRLVGGRRHLPLQQRAVVCHPSVLPVASIPRLRSLCSSPSRRTCSSGRGVRTTRPCTPTWRLSACRRRGPCEGR